MPPQSAMPPWLSKLQRQSIAVRAALLAGIVFVYGVVLCLFAWLLYGPFGAASGAVACALCLVGALMALFISHVCNTLPSPQAILIGAMLAMPVRIGIPLAVGLAIHLSGGALARAGFLYYLLLVYPLTLAIETVLSLPPTQPPSGSPPPRPTNG